MTIVAYSKMALVALQAAEELSKDGIEADVLDLRTLKPLDTETLLESVQKTGRVVIVEEGWKFSGLGAQIAETIYSRGFDSLDGPIVRVAGEEVPMPYSRPLEDLAIPDLERVVSAVRHIL